MAKKRFDFIFLITAVLLIMLAVYLFAITGNPFFVTGGFVSQGKAAKLNIFPWATLICFAALVMYLNLKIRRA